MTLSIHVHCTSSKTLDQTLMVIWSLCKEGYWTCHTWISIAITSILYSKIIHPHSEFSDTWLLPYPFLSFPSPPSKFGYACTHACVGGCHWNWSCSYFFVNFIIVQEEEENLLTVLEFFKLFFMVRSSLYLPIMCTFSAYCTGLHQLCTCMMFRVLKPPFLPPPLKKKKKNHERNLHLCLDR